MSHFLFHNNTSELNELWFESHAAILRMVCMELGATDRIDEFTKKYLGEKVKIKPYKDPNRPKRAKTAFMFYCQKHRPVLMEKQKKKNKKIEIGKIAKILGENWKKIKDKEKSEFIALATADKERYDKEIAEYNDKNGL